VGSARRSERGQALLHRAARAARLVIVDDVHRAFNLDFFQAVAARFPADGRYFFGYGSNLLAMAADEWSGILRSTLQFLDLPVLNEPPARDAQRDAEDE
jgi:hypothetical protein